MRKRTNVTVYVHIYRSSAEHEEDDTGYSRQQELLEQGGKHPGEFAWGGGSGCALTSKSSSCVPDCAGGTRKEGVQKRNSWNMWQVTPEAEICLPFKASASTHFTGLKPIQYKQNWKVKCCYLEKGVVETMPSNQTEKHETNRDTTCVDTIDLTIRITCRVLRSETNTTGKLQKK